MLSLFARIATGAPRRVLMFAAVVLVISVVLGTFSFGKLQGGGFDDPKADSILAQNELDARFGGSPNLVFLVVAKSGPIADGAAAAAGAHLTAALASDPHISNLQSFWSTPVPELESKDGRSALVMAHLKGDDSFAMSYSKRLISRFTVNNASVAIEAGGYQAVNNQVTDQVGKDLAVAESIAIPLTLVLLVIAFGAVVAALLPLVIGVLAIFGTLAALWAIGSLTDVSIYALNLTTAMGLGLGVDYALLMVGRFREELTAGAEVPDAVRTTLRTAGRTIVFSAGTVALALAALLVFPVFFLRSFAYAGVAVVLIAMLTAVVVLPAILMLLGQNVNRWRLPKMQLAGGESQFWHRLALVVVRRPIVCAVPVLIVLGVMAAPVLNVTFASPDDRVLSGDSSSHKVGDALRTDFNTDESAAMFVVLTGNPDPQSLARYAADLSRLATVQTVTTTLGTYSNGKVVSPPVPENARYQTGGSTYVDVVSSAYFVSNAGQHVVREIRNVIPPGGTSFHVGGLAPTLVDEKASVSDNLPKAIVWIVVATFVLLFAYTRSLILPIKALVLNGLTLAAVMGAMTWIFQEGNLSGLFGFTARPLDAAMPVLLFCVAFGLSMDYEVFLLSRIKEAHDTGASNVDAVVSGVSRTGRIVTTAAGLLAVSFLAFASSKVVFIQMFGLGTAMAILLDATLVRGVLVPAFMSLMGSANWWAPKSLRRTQRTSQPPIVHES